MQIIYTFLDISVCGTVLLFTNFITFLIKLMELNVQATKANDENYIFPKQWRGLCKALSSTENPLQHAESWFAESKWHVKSWKMEPLWPDLMKALCQKEPCCINNSLEFVPKIQLLPLSLQRNLLAFIVHHALEISTDSLVLLRDCYGNPNKDLTDQWSAFHLKDLQNKICLRKHKPVEYKSSDFVTIKTKCRITQNCQRLLGDVVKEVGAGDFDLTKRSLPSPLHSSCQKNLTTELKFESTSKTTGDHQVDPFICGGQNGMTMYERTDITKPISTETTRTNNTANTLQSKTENTKLTIPETTKLTSSETTSHGSTDVFDTNLQLSDDVVTTSATESLSEKRLSEGCINAKKRQIVNSRSECAIDGEDSVAGHSSEIEFKRQRVQISGQPLMAQEDEVQLGADVKEKLENIGAAWINSRKSSEGLGVLGKLNDTQMSVACRILKLEEVDTKHLVTVGQQIVKISDKLSVTGVSLLLKHCFTKKILDLVHPPSRHLINALVVFAEAFPQHIVPSVLVPVVQSSTFASAQCNLATSIVKDALKVDHKHELLRKIFENKVLWNVHVTSLIQLLVDSKLPLDEGDLNLITSGLEHQGSDQSSCPKFAKLLLALVKKYGNQLNASHVTTLKKALDLNKTFLKKAVLSAIDRLQL